MTDTASGEEGPRGSGSTQGPLNLNQKSILEVLSTVGDECPQNGSNKEPISPKRKGGTTLEGPRGSDAPRSPEVRAPAREFEVHVSYTKVVAPRLIGERCGESSLFGIALGGRLGRVLFTFAKYIIIYFPPE